MSPPVMTIPLLILAAGTILGRLINLPGLSPLQSWLFPLLEEQAGAFQFVVASLTVVLAVLGGWFGWVIYRQSPMAESTARNPLRDVCRRRLHDPGGEAVGG